MNNAVLSQREEWDVENPDNLDCDKTTAKTTVTENTLRKDGKKPASLLLYVHHSLLC